MKGSLRESVGLMLWRNAFAGKTDPIYGAISPFPWKRHWGDKPGPLIGVIEDITERKQMKAELEESEAKFATLFRAGPAFMLIMDYESGAICRCQRRL